MATSSQIYENIRIKYPHIDIKALKAGKSKANMEKLAKLYPEVADLERTLTMEKRAQKDRSKTYYRY